MRANHIAKSFPNQYKTFRWWIDDFGPAGGSFAAPSEWMSYATVKKRMYLKIERNEERCSQLPDKAKLQSGSGASCIPPRTPTIDLSLTEPSFYLKCLFFKWQLETSWTRDALKHTRDTWMTVLQIHEYGITPHKYGWFLYTCKLISLMCCIYYRDRRTRRQPVWSQVNVLNLLFSQTTEVLSEHLR